MAGVAPTPTLTLPAQVAGDWSLVDVRNHLRRMPLARIRMFPPPGDATGPDVIDSQVHEDRLYELTDSILVDKPILQKKFMKLL